jgi:tRNA (guanine-N7-)-methyltransferase
MRGPAYKKSTALLKPPPDRLYGRIRTKTLRPRQAWLLEQFLPLLSWPEVAFADPALPLWLEVGFGGGEHAQALAAAHPSINLIAAEVFETGICSLLSRLAPQVPGNLRLFTQDARPLLRALPDRALSALFLMFPDPWPKARHAKRRFVHPELVAEVARAMRPGGEWRIASDDPTYQAWTAAVLAAQPYFQVAHARTRPADFPPTRYEAKALQAGRTPQYWRLVRS